MAEIILAQAVGNGLTLAVGDASNVEYRRRQSVTLSKSYTITKLTITFGATNGTPSGQVTCRIETDNGSNQASGTLVNASATVAFTPTQNIDNTINFTDFTLAAGKYWIVLNCDNQSTNVYWALNARDSSGYAGGNAAVTEDGVWSNQATYDLGFSLYGISTDSTDICGYFEV